jgi:hypothetical protein
VFQFFADAPLKSAKQKIIIPSIDVITTRTIPNTSSYKQQQPNQTPYYFQYDHSGDQVVQWPL